jgi:hypothetical protein
LFPDEAAELIPAAAFPILQIITRSFNQQVAGVPCSAHQSKKERAMFSRPFPFVACGFI